MSGPYLVHSWCIGPGVREADVYCFSRINYCCSLSELFSVLAYLLLVKKVPSLRDPLLKEAFHFSSAQISCLYSLPKLTVKRFNKNDLGAPRLMYIAVKTSSTDYSNTHQSVRQRLSLVRARSIFPLLVRASCGEH